jgi:hypothetical protein
MLLLRFPQRRTHLSLSLFLNFRNGIKILGVFVRQYAYPFPIRYVSCEAEKRKPNLTYVNALHPIFMHFTAEITELRRVIKLTLPTNMVSTALIPKTKLRGLSPRANYMDRVTAGVVSVTDPYSRIHDFLDRSRYCFFQVAPQLYSRGWMDPVPDPLVLLSGSAGNRTRTSESVARKSDH